MLIVKKRDENNNWKFIYTFNISDEDKKKNSDLLKESNNETALFYAPLLKEDFPVIIKGGKEKEKSEETEEETEEEKKKRKKSKTIRHGAFLKGVSENLGIKDASIAHDVAVKKLASCNFIDTKNVNILASEKLNKFIIPDNIIQDENGKKYAIEVISSSMPIDKFKELEKSYEDFNIPLNVIFVEYDFKRAESGRSGLRFGTMRSLLERYLARKQGNVLYIDLYRNDYDEETNPNTCIIKARKYSDKPYNGITKYIAIKNEHLKDVKDLKNILKINKEYWDAFKGIDESYKNYVYDPSSKQLKLLSLKYETDLTGKEVWFPPEVPVTTFYEPISTLNKLYDDITNKEKSISLDKIETFHIKDLNEVINRIKKLNSYTYKEKIYDIEKYRISS